jgi:hypothetical protein
MIYANWHLLSEPAVIILAGHSFMTYVPFDGIDRETGWSNADVDVGQVWDDM